MRGWGEYCQCHENTPGRRVACQASTLNSPLTILWLYRNKITFLHLGIPSRCVVACVLFSIQTHIVIHLICKLFWLTCGSAGKESACNVGHLGLIPGWEDPLEKERLPTLVFCPGEFHGLYSSWGRKEFHKTEPLSFSLWLRTSTCKS